MRGTTFFLAHVGCAVEVIVDLCAEVSFWFACKSVTRFCFFLCVLASVGGERRLGFPVFYSFCDVSVIEVAFGLGSIVFLTQVVFQ